MCNYIEQKRHPLETSIKDDSDCYSISWIDIYNNNKMFGGFWIDFLRDVCKSNTGFVK
jgi:hypothetical protein